MTQTGFRRSLALGLLTIVVLVAISGSSWAATRQELNDFLARIQDAKGDVRRAAWENAGEMGADAVAPLGKILAGKERAAAKAAGRALEVVAHYASRPGADAERKAVSAALIELTKKGNSVKVRDKALRLLGSTGQDNAVPAIAALLGDEEVWEAARWALERIPGRAANMALLRAVNQPPRWEKSEILKFQEAIISTLGAKKSPEVVEPLMKFVRSDRENIRIAAMEALARIGDPRAASVILNAARERSGREKAIALDSYLRIGDRLAE
ncbi:HEAT repeat domain-containing protein, partial [bacterium]|nr:HEAT repeat domain-containing protein [bacterium]